MKQLLLAGIVSLVLVSSAEAGPVTRFTVVDSSPTSWVARGYQNYTVTPNDGWTFTLDRNFDNGIRFRVSGTPLTGTTVDYWDLDFAAPFDAELAPGLYNDFQRFPFQASDKPGLSFSSTGRGDNTQAGFFEIFEVSYDSAGNVLTFSADITHYGESDPSRYAILEVRYNATMATAVPEPSTFALLSIGGLALVGYGVRRRRQQAA